ncbi:MAG TPA: hypothetical protein DCY38_02375, partial [Opitutae bacterium]|nr:hypothetical protein [Opitutae bacterium]
MDDMKAGGRRGGKVKTLKVGLAEQAFLLYFDATLSTSSRSLTGVASLQTCGEPDDQWQKSRFLLEKQS